MRTLLGQAACRMVAESDDAVKACCKFRLLDLSEATGGFSAANVIGAVRMSLRPDSFGRRCIPASDAVYSGLTFQSTQQAY